MPDSMTIQVLDYCATWTGHLINAINAWNSSLQSHGRGAIQLVYVREAVTTTRQYTAGAISVFDFEPQIDGNLAWGDYEPGGSVWEGGWISFLGSVSRPDADAMAAHELGHTLMLDHVPQGSDSVMTPIASLATPSASDVANCMPGYPYPDPPVVPGKKKKKKKHRRK